MVAAFLGPATPAGWQAWEATNGQVLDEGVVVRRTLGEQTVVHDGDDGVPVDIALDRCKRLYVLVDGGTVHRYDPVVGSHRHYDVFDEEGVASGFMRPRALCLLGGVLYVATGATGDAGSSGRLFAVPRRDFVARPVVGVRPVDVVALATSDRWLYVLDAGAGPGEGVLLQVDPSGVTEPQPVVEGLTAPRDVTISPQGVLALLASDSDGRTHQVTLFTLEGHVDGSEALTPRATVEVGPTADSDLDPRCLAMWATDRHRSAHVGRLVVGGPTARSTLGGVRRYHVDDSGAEATFTLDDPIPARPTRLLAASATSDSPPVYYLVDGASDDVVSVVDQVRNRRNEQTGRFDARLVARLDAGQSGTRWHRVTLEVSEETVGPGTRGSSSQVRIRYFGTDDPSIADAPVETIPGIGKKYASRLRRAGVGTTSQLVERAVDDLVTVVATESGPTGLLRSQVQKWLAAATDRTVHWQRTPAPDPRDTLVDATGRYLWVELELVGSEYVSPRVDSLRAFFPRESYLRYLPSIYREDARSAAFLERFLSVLESGFDSIDSNVDGLTGYLDPDGVPSASLSWLGGWLGVRLDETWPEPVRRAFVVHAPDLFRSRGTPHGLVAMLRLYLDPHTDRPLDVYRTGGYSKRDDVDAREATDAALTPASIDADVSRALALWEHADLDPIDRAGARAAYSRLVNSPVGFVVLVGPDVTDEEFAALERLVATGTPAHTVGRVVRLTPWIRLGGHSYLGLNTALASRAFVLDRSILGVDSMVWDRTDVH